MSYFINGKPYLSLHLDGRMILLKIVHLNLAQHFDYELSGRLMRNKTGQAVPGFMLDLLCLFLCELKRVFFHLIRRARSFYHCDLKFI